MRGEPPPTIAWIWRDGIPLTKTERILIENTDYHTDFTLKDIDRKDAGKYTLKAENINGIDQETIELIVLGRPSKPKGPLDVTDVSKEGCKLQWARPEDDGGMPIREYEIEKKDKATGKWVRVGRVTGERSPPTYIVTGLEPGHEYDFRVCAINDEGESDHLVTEMSTVAKNPFDEPTAPGTPEITDYDNASVDLKWTAPSSDGGAPILKYVIEKKDRYKPDWEKAGEVPADKLEAKVIDLKERGEYQFRIVAVNKAGPSPPSDATKNHLVKHKMLKPRIDRANLKQVIVKAGKVVKFDVNVKGEPVPAITWLLGDKIVEEPNVEIVNVDYNTKFTIIDSKRKNSGKYMIRAENDHGKDEAEVEVVILAAPGKPKGPLKVDNVTKNGCKLKWEPPEDDGGMPVTGYALEKLDTATGRWVPMGKTKDTNFDVSGLQEGKDYQFRVKAINDEGDSEPLETEKSTKAKNPFDVPGRPGIPQIVDWDVNRVNLKWTVPKSDGGSRITSYIIEKKEKLGSVWEDFFTTDDASCEAQVLGLREGQQYQFRVKAVNKAGPGEPGDATEPHTAKARFLKPRINRDKLKNIIVRAGQIVKFDVDIKGEPAPKTAWILNKKELENGSQIKIEHEPYNTKIWISDTVRKNTGIYTLTAENDSGKDEATVEVTVLGKPSHPEGPLEVKDVTKESCTLKWDKPKDDGGLPITSYTVEKQEAGTGKWVPVGR